MKRLIDKLYKTGSLNNKEYIELLNGYDNQTANYSRELANKIRKEIFGNKIYIRGLIEISSYCKGDCLYCGIRKSNTQAQRYRLTQEEILQCCDLGYELGFRSFVLQGGEDMYFTRGKVSDTVRKIKNKFSDCAVTLSLGERPKEEYKEWFDAGADRYLLRHETADSIHYSKLHPKNTTLESRMECLYNLKEIGYQTGCGFMVGSPFQTNETLAKDLIFIQDFKPHMVGLGPFIPQHNTPFCDKEQGSLELTLFLLSLVRIMLKNVLLPSTTALGTIAPDGRELGILSGANVVMPNLSPVEVRKKYCLYDGKISADEEAAEGKDKLNNKMKTIGCELYVDRGDWKELEEIKK